MSGHALLAAREPKKLVLAVVIPFFQRQPGLLRAAVCSVLSQDSPFDVRVVVTDDESPVDPSDELQGVAGSHDRIELIRQRNAGPSAARNACLDNLPPGTTHVATLDSDDVWQPGFLQAAWVAFANGADVFFSDSCRYTDERSRFNWSDDPLLRLEGAGHQPLDTSSRVFRFNGSALDLLVKRSNVISPSTLVYKLGVAPDLRYARELHYGEDRLFKIMLVRQSASVCFSEAIGCIEGEGVNIFDRVRPGSAQAIRLSSDYVEVTRRLIRDLGSDTVHARYLQSELARLRYEVLGNVRSCVASGQLGASRSAVKRALSSDPVGLLLAFARASARRLVSGKLLPKSTRA